MVLGAWGEWGRTLRNFFLIFPGTDGCELGHAEFVGGLAEGGVRGVWILGGLRRVWALGRGW